VKSKAHYQQVKIVSRLELRTYTYSCPKSSAVALDRAPQLLPSPQSPCSSNPRALLTRSLGGGEEKALAMGVKVSYVGVIVGAIMAKF
jgi:hypothetical protein